MCTVLLPPGVNPIAVNKYMNINISKMERTRCDRYARLVCRYVKTWLTEQLSPFGHSDTATLTELKGI